MCGGAECECASGGENGEDSPQHTEDGLEMEVVADEADAADGHVIARERGRGRERGREREEGRGKGMREIKRENETTKEKEKEKAK